MWWYPIRVEDLGRARLLGFRTLYHPRGIGLSEPVATDGNRRIYDPPHPAFIWAHEDEWLAFVTWEETPCPTKC